MTHAALLFALFACAALVLAAAAMPWLRAARALDLSCGALALAGLAAAAAGILALAGNSRAILALPIGLPWFSLQVGVDPLAGVFLLLVGALLFATGIYARGYFRDEARAQALGAFLALFALGMLGVPLSQDAFGFMLFWEIMSLASYFLVLHEHARAEVRQAAWVYLVMAHLAGLFVLGAFAALHAAAHSFAFAAMRTAHPSAALAALAFLLAALGFGMKAGVMPMHGWLPDAHPAAPSPVSALMSGAMLKIAVFGFVRVVWDLLGPETMRWWEGALVLAAGASSALGGVLWALQQHELKRLLAYHSVENIGVIAIGLGLGMLLAAFGHPQLAALGLVAALYHCVNHALFKGLLFMGAGAVLHATGERMLDRLGGLARRMPKTSALFLLASAAIAALPPLNGFVSEWLTFQTALLAPNLGESLMRVLVPFSASVLALAGALAAACFVKVYGVVFLGRARSEAAAKAHEVDGWMLGGMLVSAIGCVLLGLFPSVFLALLDAVPRMLVHASLLPGLHARGWLWLTPIAPARASYAPLVALVGMLALGLVIYLRTRPQGKAVRRAPAWGCGHLVADARMQYTAASFAQPLRRVFALVLRPHEVVRRRLAPDGLHFAEIAHEAHVDDPAVRHLHRPVAKLVDRLIAIVAREHARGLHAWLAWAMAALVLVLALAGWRAWNF